MKIKWWSSISFYGSEKVKINRCPGSYNKSNGITYEINKQNQPHSPPPSSLLSIENRKRQIQTLFRGRFIHRDVNLLLHSAISICVLLCEGGGGGNTIINFTMIISHFPTQQVWVYSVFVFQPRSFLCVKESSAGVVLFVILMPQGGLAKVRSRKGSDDFSPFLVD